MAKPKNYFVIYSKLPSLNDYTNKCRSNKYEGAKLKAEVEYNIGWYIIQALNKGTLRPTKKPVRIEFIWHEKTIKRDPDNIASAKKFILDAMQKQGVIVNDNRKYIKGFTDEIVDDKEDYVEVIIREVGE